MLKKTIFPARYVQGEGALKILSKELKDFSDKAYFICDPFAKENIIPEYKEDFLKDMSINFVEFGGECSDKEIALHKEKISDEGAGIVVGIGGGKTLDASKAVAHELGLPVCVIPTIASTDAPCSALSVIYKDNGEFERYLILKKNPDLVLVDTKIITNAPARFLISGIGDALATYFEAESCQRAYSKNLSGAYGSETAFALSKLCFDILMDYSFQGVKAVESGVVTPALEKIVEANTLLSGLGFESGGLGAAHAIHNGMTAVEETHSFFHGEKVAFGVLTSLILTDRSPELINDMFYFCKNIGLPVCFEEIGLNSATDEQLKKVAELSCAEGETIYNEAYPVTPKDVYAALKTADSIGKSMCSF